MVRTPGDVIPTTSWFSIFISSRGARRKEDKQRDEIAADRHRKSRNLSPDELLARSDHNFEMKNSNIVSIQMKRNIAGRYNIKFHLNISGRKLSRNFSIEKGQVPEAKQLFTRVFQEKFTA